MSISGYEQFGLMRSDPALCFRAIVGEEPPNARKKKKKGKAKPSDRGGERDRGGREEEEEEEEEEEMSGMESEGEDGESAPSTPGTNVIILPNKRTRSSATNTPLRPGKVKHAYPVMLLCIALVYTSPPQVSLCGRL